MDRLLEEIGRFLHVEFSRIKAAAKHIQAQSQVLVAIGIGGSYLGARTGLEFVKGPFGNQLPQEGGVEVYFAGNNLSSSYIQDLLDIIGDRDFSVNVISKSGTTTEPAAFRIFKAKLEERYGKEGARERIYATTDKSRGDLPRRRAMRPLWFPTTSAGGSPA